PDRLDPGIAGKYFKCAIFDLVDLAPQPAPLCGGGNADLFQCGFENVSGGFKQAGLPNHKDRLDTVRLEPRAENARAVDAIRTAVQSAMIVNGHLRKSVACRRGDAVAHHQANGIIPGIGRYVLALGSAVVTDKNDVPGLLAVDPWRDRAEIAGNLGTQH